MKSGKLKMKTAMRTLLLAAAAAGTLFIAPPTHLSAAVLCQEPVPDCKEVIQLAQKALGGSEFFDPKPYVLNYKLRSDDPWDGPKTVTAKETYKNGKLRQDSTIRFKRKFKGRPVDYTSITDLDRNKTWESSPVFYVKDVYYYKPNYVSKPTIQLFNKTNQDNLIFDTEMPSIIEENDTKYYKLSAKLGDPKLENWHLTYLINAKNHLIYKIEQTNATESRKNVFTYKNYKHLDEIAIPHLILQESSVVKGYSVIEITINDFSFKQDIPDSLFELPTIKADFKASNAHPEWVSPDPELESRLKASVVDVVRNFPDRDYLHPDVLGNVAKHIEEMLRETGGRIETREFQRDHPILQGTYTFTNVYASYGPENGPRIVIGAHYDAVPGSPAADDNASAVAVLLELAKHLGKNAPRIRVDLAAYTLEEPGTLGSEVHAKDLKASNVNVKVMISLEMLGYFSDEPKSQRYPLGILKLFYPTKGNYICVVGKTGTGGLTKKVKKSMAKATPLPVKSLTAPVSLVRDITRSDHKSFWDQGYSAVMLTDTANLRNFYYHSNNDIPENLDYRRMAMVTVGVEKAVRELCDKYKE